MAEILKPEDLLGVREGPTIEFKREVDEKGGYLATVVAFLDGEGGDIYFGIDEQVDVATAIRGIAEPHGHEQRLLDSIADRVTPRPSIEPPRRLVAKDGSVVLALRVPKSGSGPHAVRNGSQHASHERVADRNRPLAWGEIRERLRGAASAGDGTAAALAEMRQARAAFLAEAGGTTLRVACWAVPTVPQLVDVQAKELHEALQDGETLGVRSSGWTYLSNSAVRLRQGVVEVGGQGSPTYRHLRVEARGRVEFTTDRDALWDWHAHDAERLIVDPFVLTEYPASVLRLATWILGRAEHAPEKVLVELVIREARGARLAPGRPDAVTYGAFGGWRELGSESLAVGATEALVVEAKDFLVNPDRATFRLAREAYEAFGLAESAVPFYDRSSERFVFPS